MNEPTFGLTYFLLIHICSPAFQNLLRSSTREVFVHWNSGSAYIATWNTNKKQRVWLPVFYTSSIDGLENLFNLSFFGKKTIHDPSPITFSSIFFAALKWFCWCSFSGDCDQTQVVLRVEEGLLDGCVFFFRKMEGNGTWEYLWVF